MTVSEQPSMFFIPGRTGLDIVPAAPHNRPKTQKWERGIFATQKLTASYYISRAAKEQAIVIGCSGLNTDYLLNPDEVGRLNEAGISLIWMTLPRVQHNGPIMDRYLYLAEQFFTNKNSPAQRLFTGDVPRYALTHSTGGQLFMHLLHNPETQRKLRHSFAGAVYVAPYFDSANASQNHSFRIDYTPLVKLKNFITLTPQEDLSVRHVFNVNEILFKRYFQKHKDLRPQDTLIGNAYMKVESWLDPQPVQEDVDISSTCGQILEIQAAGQRLQNNFNAKAASAIPSFFVIGDKDAFACPETSVELAEKMGAEIVIAKGGHHDPLRAHPELLDQFIQKVQDCVLERLKARANTVFIPTERFRQEPLDIPMPFNLGDSARFALQRSTGFLNTAASLFQSFS